MLYKMDFETICLKSSILMKNLPILTIRNIFFVKSANAFIFSNNFNIKDKRTSNFVNSAIGELKIISY